MGKALFILQHLKWFHNRFKNEDLSEWTIDCDDYNRIDEAIAELEAIKPKTCEGCKHKPNEGECYYEPCGTCARFFYDHYELKDNA